MTAFLDTVATVFRKEMWEHFRTKRLIVMGAIFAFVFVVLSLYGQYLTGAMDPSGGSDLGYEAGPNEVFSTVLAFTGYFPGLMAIITSYTSIVGERSRKSLILILSKPVRRPGIFLGKFLSAYCAIVLVYIVVMSAGYACVVGASGRVPSLEEVGRAYGAVGFVLLAMACWVAFAMFLSALLKNPITVAVAAIMVWFLLMPIISNIGLIYWMVGLGEEAGTPRNVDVALITQPGGAQVVALSGLESASYSLLNGTGAPLGIQVQGYYTVLDIPPGNYSWTARGTGIRRSGTLAVDGVHEYSVMYGKDLRVSASADLAVTLAKSDGAVKPSKEVEAGPFRNYTFSGDKGESRLTIRDGDRVLFTGNYTLDAPASRGMPVVTGKMPDYVKYNQLVNPDNAMTGYAQVLDPASGGVGISPAEGAGALGVFFMSFLVLGLWVFSKSEML